MRAGKNLPYNMMYYVNGYFTKCYEVAYFIYCNLSVKSIIQIVLLPDYQFFDCQTRALNYCKKNNICYNVINIDTYELTLQLENQCLQKLKGLKND